MTSRIATLANSIDAATDLAYAHGRYDGSIRGLVVGMICGVLVGATAVIALMLGA